MGDIFVVKEEHMEKLKAAKGALDNQTGFVKNAVPEDYKVLVDQAEAGLEMANELKKKKNEMQISAITKVVE